MVEVLQNSSNPKHRNSEFLKFLNQLNCGAISVDGDKIIEDPVKMEQFNIQEAERLQKEKIRQEEDAKFEEEHRKHLEMLR
jgi:hypothetical protein